MAFKLKGKELLFGINKDASTFDTPVFMKDLDGGVLAEANRDGTIFIDKSASKKEVKEAIRHEKVHLEQMKQGRLDYTDDSVIWKKDTRSPARVYKRSDMAEGSKQLEWEAEAYKKSKTK